MATNRMDSVLRNDSFGGDRQCSTPLQSTWTEQLLVVRNLLQSGNVRDGSQLLEELHERDPDNQELIGHLAYNQLHLRNWNRAEYLFGLMKAEQEKSGATNWELSYYTAVIEGARGNYQQALRECIIAIELQPEEIRPREFAAAILLRLHDYEQVLNILKPVFPRGHLTQPQAIRNFRWSNLIPRFRKQWNACKHLEGIWFLASFFLRYRQTSKMPLDKPLLSGRLKSLAGSAIATISARSDPFTWSLWERNWHWRDHLVPKESVPVPPETVEAIQTVLDATLDELFGQFDPQIAMRLLWSIRAQDAAMIYAWTKKAQPQNFVHVGNFIGMSGCLCALALKNANLPGRKQIKTVDPHIMCAQFDAQAAAQSIVKRLGLEEYISDHAGFFNHRTVAGLPESPHQVIGRTLLNDIGKVDAFFIDADHTTPGVTADILLAAEFSGPDTPILLHDVHSIDYIRRSIRDFVTQYEFRYHELEPFSIDGLGVLRAPITNSANTTA